jgi:hypothetical protein
MSCSVALFLTVLGWEYVFVFGRMWGMDMAAELHDLLDKILSTEIEFLTASEASELAGKIEQASRKLDAIAVSIVDVVDRNQLYSQDGHASATAWSAYTCRTTRREAMRRVALTKMFRSLHETERCYRAGQLGREQAGFMARAFGNPRCGHQLADSELLLLADERSLYANQFKNLMKHWVYMADAEGRQQRHDTLHEFRDLRITEQFDGGFTIEGCHGPAQGALAKALFERFVALERLADWDAARAEHGENANITHLRRTEAQRRADAFINVLLQAAAKPADAVRPEPSVTIVMTSDAYEAGLAELASAKPVKLDPKSYRTYQCQTLGGTTLTPGEALGAAMAGHVRRVVLGAKNASISQKSRTFTGPLRALIQTRDTTCIWTGCHIPSNQCQADHTTPWRHTQDTSANNGAPLCGRHNRHKERGYHTWKDPNGNWHIQRPDGTTITPTA